MSGSAARESGRIRVGFLAQENIPVPPPVTGGSVSRVVYELARQLPRDMDVTICSLRHPTIAEGVHDGIRFVHVGDELDRTRHRLAVEAIRILRRLDLPHRELQGWPGYARGYATAGLGRLAEQRPSIVHLQNVSQFLPLARRIVPDAALALHMHCPWLVELPPRIVRRSLRHASLILGVSEFIIDPVRNAFPELADRCHCLYNGVDLTTFPARSSAPADLRASAAALRERWRASGPVILYVGAMAPIKGTHVLLEAHARVLSRIPDATLVVAGTHNRYSQVAAPRSRRQRRENRLVHKRYRGEIEALARKLGGRAVLAGRIPHDEVVAHYAAADVVVMPSTGPEAFPLPVLEAFASELPVVASEIGGLPEIVHDGVNGRLVGPGDADALAEALIELCEDESLARRFGAAGRQMVADRFTWSVQARRLAALYDGVANVADEAAAA